MPLRPRLWQAPISWELEEPEGVPPARIRFADIGLSSGNWMGLLFLDHAALCLFTLVLTAQGVRPGPSLAFH